ncbi:hypothetical protein MNBD_DELTA01-692 [hydrothermal vent metagenome]|uniref:Cytochrome bd terminal oxidase subunit I n=1 Tax=hydrothermal vent metagenome TaxID=652676 RepID=A0A3B0QTJ6_9ZZZZ
MIKSNRLIRSFKVGTSRPAALWAAFFFSSIVVFFIVALSGLFPAPVEAAGLAAPVLSVGDYPTLTLISSRTLIWVVAQLHLYFAALILAVPVFVLIMEFIGFLRDDERYDRAAFEFIRISTRAFTVTFLFGVLFVVLLFLLYPHLTKYLGAIFKPTFVFYFILFILENVLLYAYRYGWQRMRSSSLKKIHIALGLLLNLTGVSIMFIANAWTTFMMSPKGISPTGVFQGGVWEAMNNPLWHPMNLHRFVANIAFAGAVVGAYSAYRFLGARTDEERARYDWMGYSANFIAIAALLPLPFAGYWLTSEIYQYSQEMGITLMGGAFGWLFIVQAVIIGALFLAANYYLWCGMSRAPGSERYTRYIKYIAFVIAVCFMVWFTPHSPQMTPQEVKAIGSSYHPTLGPLGLMPAKNIAVNIMILFTFISFLLYRRANKIATARRASILKAVQAAILAAAVINIVWLGVYYGYFTDNLYKVASSVPQVMTTLIAIVSCMVLDIFIFRGAGEVGALRWGRVAERSQYALVLLAVSYTWLMGLMGFIRSAIRRHWHVYGVVRDGSLDAYTPTLTYATRVVSIVTIIFMVLIVIIFWLGTLRKEKGKEEGGY